MTESHIDDDYQPETIAELIKRLWREGDRNGKPHKTFAQIADEQGVGPIDFEKLMEHSPGPFYEGFREDVRRMRRGLPPLGPRK